MYVERGEREGEEEASHKPVGTCCPLLYSRERHIRMDEWMDGRTDGRMDGHVRAYLGLKDPEHV